MSNEIEPRQKVVITGSSGFIGSKLIEQFKEWDVVTIDRSIKTREGVESLQWDGENQGEWSKSFDGAHAVINLAGSPISVKWTPENRKLIISSRVNSTRAVGEAITACANPPRVWVNGSATGFYGDRADDVLYESEPSGQGFLSEVCQIWEQTGLAFADRSIRQVFLRTGFVLGRDGGAFKPLKKLAYVGLGGAAGSGNQWIPWIHLEDLCRMFRFAVERDRLFGPVNGSAPEPVRNKEFMNRLRHEISRPWAPPAPSIALRLLGEITGPDSDLLLSSQRAIPKAAIEHGFSWIFPNFGGALTDLVKPLPKGAFLA